MLFRGRPVTSSSLAFFVRGWLRSARFQKAGIVIRPTDARRVHPYGSAIKTFFTVIQPVLAEDTFGMGGGVVRADTVVEGAVQGALSSSSSFLFVQGFELLRILAAPFYLDGLGMFDGAVLAFPLLNPV